MNRRHFLKALGMSGSTLSLPLMPLNLWGVTPNFNGDFLLYIQASGGWDVTSFCDPKTNIQGEPVINNWAKNAEIQTAGRINYAPVAENATFFSDHYDKTLVINGINARTNTHSAGARFNHTGSQVHGTPHLAAIYAQEKAKGMVMPVMAGTDFVSGGLLPPTALGPGAFKLINPNLWKPKVLDDAYLPEQDLSAVRTFRRQRAENLNNKTHLLPKQRKQILDYYNANTANTLGFEHFQDMFFGLEQGKYMINRHSEALKVALTAFYVGLGVAADMSIQGFDSHENHDSEFAQRMSLLTDAVGCAWHYADQLGIADRLVVVISSDFGRTPHYNSQGGKDHWHYGSTLVMKKNARWTNRMVGYTDDGHVGQPINPHTLKPDTTNGIEIEPRHVMQALRRMLGVAESASATQFDLAVPQEFNFFS